MNIKRKRILLLITALAIAVACAFIMDRICYQTEPDESPIFTDGSEAFAIYGCEIRGNTIVITWQDPQFAVKASNKEVSQIRILFEQPVSQDISLQLFYTYQDEDFNEPNSIRTTIPFGSNEAQIDLPQKAVYSNFRFDFEQDVSIQVIISRNATQTLYAFHLGTVRMISFALVIFIPLCAVIILITKKKENKAQETKNNKSIWVIVFCNLLLSFTVVFFQPLGYMLANLNTFLFSFGQVWWIQLLIAVCTTGLLSFLMLLLPPKWGRIAAAVSLGLGLAFSAQCLLFNGGRPLSMNSSFSDESLDLCVWFGIFALTVAEVQCFYRDYPDKQKTTNTVIIVIASLILLVQALNFIVMTTATEKPIQKDAIYLKPEYQELSANSRLDYLKMEENMICISMFRGMPIPLKGYFKFDMETVNLTSFTGNGLTEEESTGLTE